VRLPGRPYVLRRRLRRHEHRCEKLWHLRQRVPGGSGVQRRPLRGHVPERHDAVWRDVCEHSDQRDPLRRLRCRLHGRRGLPGRQVRVSHGSDLVRRLVHEHVGGSRPLRRLRHALSPGPGVRRGPLRHRLPRRSDGVRGRLREHVDGSRSLRRLRHALHDRRQLRPGPVRLSRRSDGVRR
jgi:hypothetical protein